MTHQDDTTALVRQIAQLSPADQFRIAFLVAENVGYVLKPEPEHPDSPHALAARQDGADQRMLEDMRLADNVRAAAIEECARVADDHATATCTGMGSETAASQLCARSIAGLIRQLKISDEQ